MNRAQRRSNHQKATAPAPSQNTWAAVIAASQTTQPAVADDSMTRLHAAFADLRAGSSDNELFDRLAAAINVGMVRAELIDELCVPPMLAARDALIRCDAIRGKHGRYGFDGPGLQAMATGLEVYEEILRNSSPQQMTEALHHAMTRMRRQVAEEIALRPRPLPLPLSLNA